MKTHAFRFILAAALTLCLGVAAHAQNLAPGQIKAAKVEHAVMRVAANGTATPLKDGDALTETDTVRTGNDSSVVLVFMNGSSVKLGPDSELKIEEFQMDPLAAGSELKMADLQDEPTISKTTLSLAHGELVGSVKKLHTDRGSSYNIRTPVGAAGIRGTVFRIVFRPTSDGKAFFTVSTAEGRVVMQGVTQNEIPIPAGKEVVVQADVTLTPPTPGKGGETPTPTPAVSNVVVVTQDIPPATTNAITAAAATITQTLQTTTFTPTAGSGGGTSGGDNTTPPPSGDSGKSGDSGTQQGGQGTQTPPPVVPPTTPTSTPRLTPGDGG